MTPPHHVVAAAFSTPPSLPTPLRLVEQREKLRDELKELLFFLKRNGTLLHKRREALESTATTHPPPPTPHH